VIEVASSATNWIKLKGPGLGDWPGSTIARHGDRWEIELDADGFGINTATARTRMGVLERLDELLDNVYLSDVQIAREEIVHYMDRVLCFSEEHGW
jgi:hypothetical protein